MTSENRAVLLLSRSARMLLIIIGIFGLVLAAGTPVQAAGTTASPVPQPRWNSSSAIRPGAIIGDSTYFAGHTDPKDGLILMYHALDIEGHYMFTATGQGMQVIDLANPAQPSVKSYLYGYITGGAFPIWEYSDKDWYIKQIDAPAGNTDLVALTLEDQGFAIVKTLNKDAPVVTYQRKIEVSKVYAFTSGSTAYAYATDMNDSGVYLFNMTASSGMIRCNEHPPEVSCPGVYQGAVSALGNGNSGLDGVGNFLVTGKTGRSNSGNMKVWNISNPAQPTPLVEIAGSSTAVAMWQQGSAYYAARLDATGKQLSIYNVSCIASGSCSGAPLVWTGTVSTHLLSHVTASTDGGKSYLYLGGEDLGTCASQREYIYDVSSPGAPEELTPKIDPLGYWGWYYMGCPTGFNLVGPRVGKVYGGYLYRAAMSILDSHQIVRSGPPVANFTWSPEAVYPNTPVQFTDASSGGPNSWSWTFAGGTPSGASTSNPQVSFSSTGSKSVTLTVGRDGVQSEATSKTVNVLDPTPQVAGVTVPPASLVVCQPVTLKATGATGQPTLSYSWEVRDSGGNLMPNGTGGGDPFVWNTSGSTPAGSYTGTVTVSNSSGAATASGTFSLGALAALPLGGQFLPTNEAFTAGTVKFHVSVPGATAWSWDFDDDANPVTSNFTDFSNDPVTGPNPIHPYATIGARVVRVRVKNCTTVDPNGVLSGALPVAITQISPLVARFLTTHISCSGGTDGNGDADDSRVCIVDAGDPLGIADASTGAERWDYDWDGNGTWEDADNTSPRATHTYSTPGTFTPNLRVRRGNEENVFTKGGSVVVGASVPPVPAGIFISGASSGQPNQALTFTASGTGSCTPSPSGWSWSAGGGNITGGTSSQVSITWTSTGTKNISASNSACGSASGSKSVTISTGTTPPPPPPPPTTLQADFTFSPAAPISGQVVSLNGAISTGSPQGYVWDFGDGSPFGSGAQVTHTFAQAGSYIVSLSVNKPGNCAPAPFCESTKTKTVVVGTGEPPLGAAFGTSATCTQEFGLSLCTAVADEPVTFTDQSSGTPTSWSWSFGDGSTAAGRTASHTFANGGAFTVSLTVGRGTSTSTTTKTFTVTEPIQTTSSVVLPWIAQSRGALDQSSDLYIHNPGTAAMNVTIEFRKRGTPENNPPRVNRTIQPGATLFVEDALDELFNRENVAGFITVIVDGRVEPVITSFNTTVQDDGSRFGQTIPGVSMSRSNQSVAAAAAATAPRLQHLVGLNDNSERLAYFGISNPSESSTTYRLKFFDNLGHTIGETGDIVVPRFGQTQFQVQRIRDEFHVSDADDYRVQIETPSGVQVFPYAANLRIASDDPSFVGSGSTATSKVYLLGALSSPGINNSIWQSDVVLSNTGSQVVLTDMKFTRVGATSTPTPEVTLTLQPGETQRLVNAIAARWGVRDAVGVLTLESDSPNGIYPIVQGESYENSRPSRRFGQSMAAFTDADAAGPGQSHLTVGLRQDNASRTTYWIFNPSNVGGDYDIVYRALDGSVLGRINGVKLGPGKMRQVSPSQHPIPAAGVEGGFTIQVVVRSGKALSAAQVINNATNDPAYIEGKVR